MISDGIPNRRLTADMNREEVEVALKGMKNGKAMGGENARRMERQCDCTHL